MYRVVIVPVEIKFCGLTRPEDAAAGAEAGAAYLGVVFAAGPRRVQPDRARVILDGAAGFAARRVGVFGRAAPSAVAAAAERAALDVIQLHDDPTPREVRAVRAATGCEVWAAVRLGEKGHVPDIFDELAEVAGALLLEARVPGQLGGTGVVLPWHAVAASLAGSVHSRVYGPHAPQAPVRMVLAGGLTAASVSEAIRALGPDIVDVSSGMESAPGIKDHERMRAFAAAVRATLVP